MPEFPIRPVTSQTWEDFTVLFEARGAPHYCWCSVYRIPGRRHLDPNEKKMAMRQLVENAIPVGVLAYHEEAPVGWCSIAPRETYSRLDHSRKMARVTLPEVNTWTVLCFFVPRQLRGRGVSAALLTGAIGYARSKGAQVIEAYPFDTAGTSSTHRGHSSLFKRAGFIRDGQRWFLEIDPP